MCPAPGFLAALALASAGTLAAAEPSALTRTIEDFDRLAVGDAVSVTGLRVGAGRISCLLKSGRVAPVRAGGERVRVEVARVFAEAARHLPTSVADLPENEAIRAHGRLDASSHRGAAEALLRDVVLPGARALLAPSPEPLAALAAGAAA